MSASEISEGRTGFPAGGVPPLVLSGAERTQEALTAAAVSLEYGRIVGAGDARRAAAYAAQVVDNSRALPPRRLGGEGVAGGGICGISGGA
jgi:hypothetical protein